ncbi:uncharacterized protein N7479_001414 [Penicillium vulpinum]|uniref:Phosphoesterase n=1 Tax=Penicillium vulpinum TaxID=29845 RepID=A0A1V6RTZ5_9EURO|nr:uncharacterized protein N7479_001414 [Penicillium vulpinum]KAJ5971496.1 hypothetical protein N7479_001414 [Penicillium vulpinum]OQE05242.1 hypothetical protein PENVUL_c026G06647 [Penicillium vulpinum]
MARSLLFVALSLGAAAMPASSGMSNIKNIVVLVQENLSFDHFAGGLDYDSSIDGPQNPQYCNPANVSIPTSDQVCASPSAKNIASDDPNHSIAGGNMQVFGTYHPLVGAKSSMNGFISEQRASYPKDDLNRAAEAINYFNPDHIPVFNNIAQNFVLFDRWFAAVPGPTNPNRAYLTSGTSHGHGRNDNDFMTSSLPQKSIFEQLSEKGITWKNYENSTQSKPAFLPDAMFYDWTAQNAKDNVVPISQFYTDAKAGALPQFTWINPECCSYMSMHPPSPINMGENFVKSIYEAIRNSPQWDETLFILTWDEHGGFADHVSPPTDVPAGDSLTYTEKAQDGQEYTFHFDRLGIRVPTVLISPWVSKGLVQHKPIDGNEFTHTSILKFVSELWGLESLSPRVDWSPSFGNLITNNFRSDTPEKLPNAADF